MIMNPEKLAQLQASVRIGGKGTPRRKVKKQTKSAAADDKKLQAALKKLNTQPIGGIEEVNMFMDGEKVLHFPNPKVQASVSSNLFVIGGEGQEKNLQDLLPGIVPQMGTEYFNKLRTMAEAAGGLDQVKEGEDDDEVPNLVETFDE